MENEEKNLALPESSKISKASRIALELAGAVPYVGSVFSTVAGAWSEKEQDKVNHCFHSWIKMLQDELREKEITMIEILSRLDLQDEKIRTRVESKEYQGIIKKTFREWSGAESEEKRKFIRNILSNAAASSISSDDVVRLFISWIAIYSELHFKVIGAIYNEHGISRGGVWNKLGRVHVEEDSADADLFKLFFRDLSTGGIIRQIKEVDYYGNPIRKPRAAKGSGPKAPTSAFDDEDQYELTALGKQFVHYAMSDLPPKIDFKKYDPTSEIN